MPLGKLVTKVLRRDALPVPDNLPTKTRCIKVTIPDDLQYLNHFYAMISLLGKWNSYQQDGAHKAAEVAQLWRNVFWKFPIEDCVSLAGSNGPDEDDFMIRQSPTNPCILESSVDGINWCQWADLSLCLKANPDQPGPGGEGPGEGQTEEHCLKLSGNGQVILPIPVSDGQIITVHTVQGGWTDGGGNWYCPNGQSYTLGFCTGVGGYTGGDPAITALHMSIVALIDGVYYPTNGPIVVPNGTGTVDCVFQANDATLSDNYGDIQFCVTVETQESFFAIGYTQGTGPAVARPGDTILIHSTDEGVVAGQNLHEFNISVAPCAKLTLLSVTGWSLYNPTGPSTLWGETPCGGSRDSSHTVGSGLTTIPLPVVDNNHEQLDVSSQSAFTALVKVEAV